MKTMMKTMIAAVAVVTAFASPALAQPADTAPINYTITGATVQGFYKVVVDALNGVVREAYPNSAASFKPSSPAGGLQMIGTGQADFGLAVSAPEIEYALEAKPPFKESLKGKFAHVLLLNEQQAFHPVMTKEFADRNGIKSFADMAAKKPRMRVHINTLANIQASVGFAEIAMNVEGFSSADIEKWGGSIHRGNSGEGLEALADGKVDVYLNGGFLIDARLHELSRKRPIVWIASDEAKLAKGIEKWNFKIASAPKEFYTFLDRDMPTIIQWSNINAGTHVPEETVYKFVKALAEGEATVRSIHPSLKEFDAAFMARNPTGLPFHPGAERYYREKGLLK
jgi:TRAP transporter TAXI family solute receptor